MTPGGAAARGTLVGNFRHFFRQRPGIAALLLAAALCLKIFVPVGYMPAPVGSDLVVALCSGSAPAGTTVQIHIPGKGPQDDAPKSVDHPCAFAPLGAAALGSAPPMLALAALFFVFVAAILRRPLDLQPIDAQIRPPSQGPPSFA